MNTVRGLPKPPIYVTLHRRQVLPCTNAQRCLPAVSHAPLAFLRLLQPLTTPQGLACTAVTCPRLCLPPAACSQTFRLLIYHVTLLLFIIYYDSTYCLPPLFPYYYLNPGCSSDPHSFLFRSLLGMFM